MVTSKQYENLENWANDRRLRSSDEYSVYARKASYLLDDFKKHFQSVASMTVGLADTSKIKLDRWTDRNFLRLGKVEIPSLEENIFGDSRQNSVKRMLKYGLFSPYMRALRLNLVAELYPETALKSPVFDFKKLMANISKPTLETKFEDIIKELEQINEFVKIERDIGRKESANMTVEKVDIPQYQVKNPIENKGAIKIGAYVVPLARKEQTYDPKFMKIGAGIGKPPKVPTGDLEYQKAFVEVKRARRKNHKYKGKPTYFELKFVRTKELGYMKRSLNYQYKKNPIGLIPSFNKLLERLRKSKTHAMMGQVSKAELIVTLEIAGTRELASAYMQLTEKIFQDEMSRNQIDAWDIYIMDDAPKQIFDMYFEPTLMAFMELTQHVRNFIRDNWDLYDERKQTYLSKKTGRYFTKGQEKELYAFLEKAGARSNNDYSASRLEWRRKD